MVSDTAGTDSSTMRGAHRHQPGPRRRGGPAQHHGRVPRAVVEARAVPAEWLGGTVDGLGVVDQVPLEVPLGAGEPRPLGHPPRSVGDHPLDVPVGVVDDHLGHHTGAARRVALGRPLPVRQDAHRIGPARAAGVRSGREPRSTSSRDSCRPGPCRPGHRSRTARTAGPRTRRPAPDGSARDRGGTHGGRRCTGRARPSRSPPGGSTTPSTRDRPTPSRTWRPPRPPPAVRLRPRSARSTGRRRPGPAMGRHRARRPARPSPPARCPTPWAPARRRSPVR